MRKINSLLIAMGFNFNRTYRFIFGLVRYYRDKNIIQKQIAGDNKFKFGKAYPMLNDKYSECEVARGHYFHQDLLIASMVFANNPLKHVDIGSSVRGFVAHVASFRKIEVFDIRHLSTSADNIVFMQADLMVDVDDTFVDYCDSLSCLHALEHFGLGRYGDPIKHDGYIDGLKNIYKMIKPTGKLYLSVPIGIQRIEFNAHRIFSLNYLCDLLLDDYKLDTFSYVDDKGDLYKNVKLDFQNNVLDNFGCNFGLGIFELTKI